MSHDLVAVNNFLEQPLNPKSMLYTKRGEELTEITRRDVLDSLSIPFETLAEFSEQENEFIIRCLGKIGNGDYCKSFLQTLKKNRNIDPKDIDEIIGFREGEGRNFELSIYSVLDILFSLPQSVKKNFIDIIKMGIGHYDKYGLMFVYHIRRIGGTNQKNLEAQNKKENFINALSKTGIQIPYVIKTLNKLDGKDQLEFYNNVDDYGDYIKNLLIKE